MTVKTWPLAKIIPYARNPRHNAGAVDAVASSLQEFGWQQPIVVDPSGVIVVGDTRYRAAVKLGWTEAPVHVASDLTPTQIKAYRIADNRTNENASWDNELLKLEFEDLTLAGYDLGLTAFTAAEMGDVFLEDTASPGSNSNAGAERSAPDTFAEFDESIATEHQCPKCGYRFSGRTSAQTPPFDVVDDPEDGST